MGIKLPDDYTKIKELMLNDIILYVFNYLLPLVDVLVLTLKLQVSQYWLVSTSLHLKVVLKHFVLTKVLLIEELVYFRILLDIVCIFQKLIFQVAKPMEIGVLSIDRTKI